MKDFLSLTKARKTTYEFDNRQVSDAALGKILDAGRWAPSCGNSQSWHFIVIEDKKKIKKLTMTANYGDFHTDAPLMVALVLIKKLCPGRGFSCFKGHDSFVHDSYMCIGMAALNMLLEARDLNIDSCLLTPHQNKVKSILKIKKEDVVPLLIGFGYQKKGVFQKKRDRNGLKDVVSYELFGRRK
ncbi:TPA: hypothetical protein HA219_02675 [Candidatus Woesearchaeota archaeon]|nr:nitroreductase family protein [Candidatus Woesearchaeota archaeon]HIH39597.1 hypothetical protein [Candidatus Woesearchaeota archaeon]